MSSLLAHRASSALKATGAVWSHVMHGSWTYRGYPSRFRCGSSRTSAAVAPHRHSLRRLQGSFGISPIAQVNGL